MKLSEIQGDRVFDVIADIIDPIATIASDEEAMKLFDSSDKPEDKTPWEYFVQRARTAVPVLMREYKNELCVILASLNGVTKDEYVNGVRNPDYDPNADPDDEDFEKKESEYLIWPLTVPKLFSDVLDLVTDSSFVSFFS